MIARRGDYGVDAPYVPLGLGAGALVFGALGAWNLAAGRLGAALANLPSAVVLLGSAASYLYTTRRGKLVAWDALLESLSLRGDERVLDVGCGRGAVLLLAAQRVPRGKATGVDLWRAQDQSGNAEAVTRGNAEREGVSDRVELATGDMRTLPFADGSFDLVVSSLAIHNVPDAAVREVARVLAPGGRIALADFRFVDDYARELRDAGLEVEVRSLGPRFWYGGPWARTRVVLARRR
jgi:SAM-dependent methyltransferase